MAVAHWRAGRQCVRIKLAQVQSVGALVQQIRPIAGMVRQISQATARQRQAAEELMHGIHGEPEGNMRRLRGISDSSARQAAMVGEQQALCSRYLT
ncbi:hypothetical protein [Pseudomonas zhanjiangensis]|uniref:Uncharacterized protein n=1 Tax=Pseudomonas zhanjiangensis TaxID=3239015 RepID=A0ABV3YSF0_9PSED